MAVPTGSYELHATLDLSPLFGTIDQTHEVDVKTPDDDILEQRLAQLRAKDANVRRTALIDLRYFKQEAEQVVPALVRCLEDEEPMVRQVALSVMMSYPKQAAEHVEKVLSILEGGPAASVSERSIAAQLLGRVAPLSARVKTALEKAHREADDRMKLSFESALRSYRRRSGKE